MLHFFGLDIDLGDFFSWSAGWMWVLIPVAAIIWLMVSSLSEEKTKRHNREMIHRERMAAIEKGLDEPYDETTLPSALIHREDQTGLLTSGIISMAAGLGIAVFLAILVDPDDRNVMAVGFVPFFVGIGLVVAWWVTRRFTDQANGREQKRKM